MKRIPKKGTGVSLAKRNIQKLRSNKLAILGLGLFLLVVVMCVFAPMLSNGDPNRIDVSQRYLPPSMEHPLGTDQSGRDVWGRDSVCRKNINYDWID